MVVSARSTRRRTSTCESHHRSSQKRLTRPDVHPSGPDRRPPAQVLHLARHLPSGNGSHHRDCHRTRTPRRRHSHRSRCDHLAAHQTAPRPTTLAPPRGHVPALRCGPKVSEPCHGTTLRIAGMRHLDRRREGDLSAWSNRLTGEVGVLGIVEPDERYESGHEGAQHGADHKCEPAEDETEHRTERDNR